MATRLMLKKTNLVAAGLALAVFLFGVLSLAIIFKSDFTPIVTTSTYPVVTIKQRGRTFHLDTLTITRHTILHIINYDTVTHHVYVKSPAFNFDSGE
jgi:hypothetical protein